MRAFTAILVVCVGTLLPFECVNGDAIETIKILSPDGSYIPGSMLAWNTYYNNMKKHTDAVGLECILVLENEVIPIDIALINGDMVGVAKILRKVLPYVRKLALHLKDEGLRKSIEYAGDEAEKTIAQLEADGANISMFSSLVEATTVNLRDILKALIYSVVDLVGNVIHAIHH